MNGISPEDQRRSSPISSDASVLPRQELERVAADHRISQKLLENGTITQRQYDAAIRRRDARSGSIVDNLISLGHVELPVLVDFLLSYPTELGVDVSDIEISPKLIQLLPHELAHKYQAIPLDFGHETLLLGVATPIAREDQEIIGKAVGLVPKVVLCSQEDILTALNSYYPSDKMPETDVAASKGTASARLSVSTKLSHVVHMIHQITSLPALPETIIRVRETMDNPDSSVQQVVDIITLDPPVAAKVLSTANSPAYGFRHRVNTLQMAVTLLGLRETYGVVLSVAIADLANKLEHFDYESFWLESMYSAAAARIVAKAANRRHLEGVFSAALLHDIGRVVLLELQPNYAKLLPNPLWGRELVEEEERVIGLSHPEAGYELARHWDLPGEMVEAIRFHHAPEHATQAPEHTAIVALANVMARTSKQEFDEHETIFEGCESALETLGMDAEITKAMLSDFFVLRAKTLDDGPGQ
ncbi:HDOD domain-containing protein [Candidatus Hydrogenedentota bacterium]